MRGGSASKHRHGTVMGAAAAPLVGMAAVARGQGGVDAPPAQSGGAMEVVTTYSGLIELPFLLLAVVFGFLTARALRGSAFGRGMLLIAFGALVMAVGHLHMQTVSLFEFNIFSFLLGDSIGATAWVLALVTTWTLTGLGFFSMYRAGRAAA